MDSALTSFLLRPAGAVACVKNVRRATRFVLTFFGRIWGLVTVANQLSTDSIIFLLLGGIRLHPSAMSEATDIRI